MPQREVAPVKELRCLEVSNEPPGESGAQQAQQSSRCERSWSKGKSHEPVVELAAGDRPAERTSAHRGQPNEPHHVRTADRGGERQVDRGDGSEEDEGDGDREERAEDTSERNQEIA